LTIEQGLAITEIKKTLIDPIQDSKFHLNLRKTSVLVLALAVHETGGSCFQKRPNFASRVGRLNKKTTPSILKYKVSQNVRHQDKISEKSNPTKFDQIFRKRKYI